MSDSWIDAIFKAANVARLEGLANALEPLMSRAEGGVDDAFVRRREAVAEAHRIVSILGALHEKRPDLPKCREIE